MENKDFITQLEEQRKAIEAEKQVSREFISSVSHELRTPVAVLRGSLEALCDGVIFEKELVDEYHKRMLAESIYLQRLVNDLLEFSRLQNAEFRIDMDYINICDVISDVCRSITQIANQKNIELIFENSETVYINKADYARLRQMFIVIFDNAVKFTNSGGKVIVNSSISDGVLKVSVSDTGCGIEDSELDKIFVKFHRSFSNQNRNGSGLGLAIAKEIADRHNIKIIVNSTLGVGTEFIFVFPSAEMIPED